MAFFHPLSWRHHALVIGSLLAIAAVDPPGGPAPVLGGLVVLYGVVIVLVQFWSWRVERGSAAGRPCDELTPD